MGNTHVVLSELLNKELYVIVIFLIAILFFGRDHHVYA